MADGTITTDMLVPTLLCPTLPPPPDLPGEAGGGGRAKTNSFLMACSCLQCPVGGRADWKFKSESPTV